MHGATLGVVIGAGSTIVGVLFWIELVVMIGALSGWRRIAREFRTDRVPEGKPFPRQTMYGRGRSRYRGVVDMFAARDGLYLVIHFWFFRFGHPPLFLPWNALSALRNDGSHIAISVGAPEVSQLRIPRDVWAARPA